ncbi:hypothetical protein [Kitasatospora sp. NPDC089509]|uniref:hypothetical protein n=1 Tax=Kitasatospora sp. NPDC089509 TaxID=3364079 RepID=UPI00382038C0
MSHTTTTTTTTSVPDSRRLTGWGAAALLPLTLAGVLATATAASAAPSHHRARPVAAGHGHKSEDSTYEWFDRISARAVNAVHGRAYCDYNEQVYQSVAGGPGMNLSFTRAVAKTATWSTTGGVKISLPVLKAALNLEGSVTNTKTNQVTVQENIAWTVPADTMGVLDVYVRYQDWDFQTVGGLSHRFLGTGHAKIPVGLCGSRTSYPDKRQDCGPMLISCLFQGVEIDSPQAHIRHRALRHTRVVARLHR